jgi:hypothetical protein
MARVRERGVLPWGRGEVRSEWKEGIASREREERGGSRRSPCTAPTAPRAGLVRIVGDLRCWWTWCRSKGAVRGCGAVRAWGARRDSTRGFTQVGTRVPKCLLL